MPASASVPVTLGLPAGAAPGDHEVVVTASAPGVPDVVRTLDGDAQGAAHLRGGPRLPCAVDLAGERNHDGTATVAASTEGNFDGGGWSYDAALLPAAGSWEHGGVAYAVPSPVGTTPNFVEARGQTLLVPAGARSTLRLIGASHGGDVSTALRVTYTDGSVADVPVSLTDWAAGGGRNGNTVAHRHGPPDPGGPGRRRAAGAAVRGVSGATDGSQAAAVDHPARTTRGSRCTR